MTQIINILKATLSIIVSSILAALFLALALAGILFLGSVGAIAVAIRITYVIITAWLDYCKEEIKEKL